MRPATGKADTEINAAFLVTGTSGFVGRVLCAELMCRQYSVHGTVRCNPANEAMMYPVVRVPDIGPGTDWTTILQGMDVVIHLAARVHVVSDTVADPLAEFRRINTAGTEHLARSAAASGVKRLVYVSTVKVNGGCDRW